MLSITGADAARIINGDSLTIFAKARRGYGGNFVGYPNLYSVNDGSLNNQIQCYGTINGTALTNLPIRSNNIAQTDYVQIAETTTNPFAIAQALSANDSLFAGKGTLTATDTSVTMPIGLNKISIGSDYAGINQWTGYIEEFAMFRSRLQNRDLILLTQ